MEQVIRPATTDEKRDMQELTGRHKDIFLDKLAQERLKHDKEHKPFCVRCAKIDYQDKIDNIVKERQRMVGHELTQDEINAEQEKIRLDFDKYGDLNRFDLTEEAEITEKKFIDGVWMPYVTGYYQNFKCKIRGCGLAVEVPVKEFNDRKGLKQDKSNNKI